MQPGHGLRLHALRPETARRTIQPLARAGGIAGRLRLPRPGGQGARHLRQAANLLPEARGFIPIRHGGRRVAARRGNTRLLSRASRAQRYRHSLPFIRLQAIRERLCGGGGIALRQLDFAMQQGGLRAQQRRGCHRLQLGQPRQRRGGVTNTPVGARTGSQQFHAPIAAHARVGQGFLDGRPRFAGLVFRQEALRAIDRRHRQGVGIIHGPRAHLRPLEGTGAAPIIAARVETAPGGHVRHPIFIRHLRRRRRGAPRQQHDRQRSRPPNYEP